MYVLTRFKQYLKSLKLIWDECKRSREAEKHVGERYECPFCGFRSYDLMPVGDETEVSKKYAPIGLGPVGKGGSRPGMCWKCGAKDREKLIYIYLRDIKKIFAGNPLKVLHIAPEEMIAKQILKAENIDYVCGDLFAKGYLYPPYVHNMNVLDLPFSDETFDLVICNHVLEHIDDDCKAMRELYRVLKKGGTALLQVPMSKKLNKTLEDTSMLTADQRLKAFGQIDHLRLYGLDYKDRLERCGFIVELTNISGGKNEKYGLNKEEDLYVCHR